MSKRDLKFLLVSGMQGNNLKKAALVYARYIPVFPVWGIGNGRCLCGDAECTNPGKHPIVKGGFKAATTNRDKIIKYWTEHPKANIGSPLVEGLIALDFDGKKGLIAFEQLGLENVKTPKVITGKGFHLYFYADLKSKNNAMSGLDIRGGGEGGYIILPPSKHISGKRYKWEK